MRILGQRRDGALAVDLGGTVVLLRHGLCSPPIPALDDKTLTRYGPWVASAADAWTVTQRLRRARTVPLSTFVLGDLPGHPFRGNQWTTGEGSDKTKYPVARSGPSMLEAKGGLDTLKQFTRPDGTLTPERQALHDALVKQLSPTGPKPDAPVTYLMGGGSASGKSTMRKMLAASGAVPNDVTHVDVDQIRQMLPEWKTERAAAAAAGRSANEALAPYTHEESSAISKRVIDNAAKGGYNVSIDGTGDSSLDKLTANVARARAGGQKVIANYATVDYPQAYARMRARGDEIDPETGQTNGRYVPAAEMRGIHQAISMIVPQAIKNGLFDQFNLWDTSDTPTGERQAPVKVASAVGKNLTIHNQAAWDRFLARGKGIPPVPGEI